MRDFAKRAFDKRHPVILTALRALAQTDGVVYGGFAMNLLCPPDRRFYKEGEDLFDIDVHSKHPKKTVKVVLEALKREGFPAVSARPGLHEGTIKVYARGINVMDVTAVRSDNVPININNTILARYHGILVRLEGLNSLVEGALLVLAKPGESGFRWEKMAHRLVSFLGAFRPQVRPKVEEMTDSENASKMYRFAAKNGCGVIYNSENSAINSHSPFTVVLATKEVVKRMERVPPSPMARNLLRGLSFHLQDALPDIVTHYLGRHLGRDIYGIVTPENCICAKSGKTCAAFRIIIYYRLSMPIHMHFQLGLLVLDYFSRRNNDLSRLVYSKCIGSQEGLATILERINS